MDGLLRILNMNKSYSELPRMDVYSTYGTKVMFDMPEAGYPYDQEKLKENGLIVGKIYTIDKTEVSSSYTDVYLVGFPGIKFNSVNFGAISYPEI